MSRILFISLLIFPVVVLGATLVEKTAPPIPCATDVATLQHQVVKTAEELRRILLKLAQKGSLVVWDADLTLCRPKGLRIKDHALRLQEVMKRLSPEERDDFQATVASFPMSLVNKGIPDIIDSLNVLGVESIVLTARLAGTAPSAFDKPISMEELTYRQLRQLGINLAENFGGVCEKEVDSPLYHGNKPVFYKGVLVSNGEYGPGCSKGDVFVKFLQDADDVPKIIGMVDDKKENLDSVQKALAEHFPHVVFHGVQYLEAFQPGDVSPPPQGVDYSRFLSACLEQRDPLSLPPPSVAVVEVTKVSGRVEKRGASNSLKLSPLFRQPLKTSVKMGVTLQVGAPHFLKTAKDSVLRILLSGLVEGYLTPQNIARALLLMMDDPQVYFLVRFMCECMRDGASPLIEGMHRLSIGQKLV